ncbi:hypothetical protein H9564_07525 [Limosilactobacillus sp. Sa3CUN2]|uniref:Mub B2-like domain-containing protein n=1 Tax=Limosilactobacillus avistercoris TaxID=2762243 RepID=A0ABR8PE23_9LACO|nr:hypothetical protein [Limosilactobacillus avistercoris]MBD7895540.1 hypothetical protein [Limosilactobacillus avistercoris]
MDGTTDTTTQTAKIYRDAIYDDVTGKLTNLSAWSTGKWDAYTPDQVPGYHTEIMEGQTPLSSIDEQTVTAATPSVVITVTYVPDSVTPPVTENATETVRFVDQATGQTVGSKDYSGKLNQTLPVSFELPEGYKLAEGQELPTKITISNGVITIEVVADTSTNPDQPTTPSQPDQPGKPDNPGNPGQLTTPPQPAQPGETGGQPVSPDEDGNGNPGENVNVPVDNNQVPGHIANDQSLTSQIAHHVNGTNKQAHQ